VNVRRLVGLCGRKRSGKDTVGAFLAQRYGWQPESFARPLKTAVRDIFGWTSEHTDGDLKEIVDPFWGLSPRIVMQRFGTEVGRQIDENLWIRSLQKRLENLSGSTVRDVVITDVRFENEARMVREAGGQIWRIERPDLGPAVDLHPSETEFLLFDADEVLVNDGSVQDLHIKAASLVRNWRW